MEKRILTEEQKKLLQGYLPFNSKNTVEFIPSLFEKLEDDIKPTFKVRSLNNGEQTQLKADSAKFYNDIKDKTDEQKVELLKELSSKTEELMYKCVLGFSKFFDVGSGEEIVFVKEPNQDYIAKDLYLMIPEWIRAEIIAFIRKISCLSQLEELSLK